MTPAWELLEVWGRCKSHTAPGMWVWGRCGLAVMAQWVWSRWGLVNACAWKVCRWVLVWVCWCEAGTCVEQVCVCVYV